MTALMWPKRAFINLHFALLYVHKKCCADTQNPFELVKESQKSESINQNKVLKEESFSTAVPKHDDMCHNFFLIQQIQQKFQLQDFIR